MNKLLAMRSTKEKRHLSENELRPAAKDDQKRKTTNYCQRNGGRFGHRSRTDEAVGINLSRGVAEISETKQGKLRVETSAISPDTDRIHPGSPIQNCEK